MSLRGWRGWEHPPPESSPGRRRSTSAVGPQVQGQGCCVLPRHPGVLCSTGPGMQQHSCHYKARASSILPELGESLAHSNSSTPLPRRLCKAHAAPPRTRLPKRQRHWVAGNALLRHICIMLACPRLRDLCPICMNMRWGHRHCHASPGVGRAAASDWHRQAGPLYRCRLYMATHH